MICKTRRPSVSGGGFGGRATVNGALVASTVDQVAAAEHVGDDGCVLVALGLETAGGGSMARVGAEAVAPAVVDEVVAGAGGGS